MNSRGVLLREALMGEGSSALAGLRKLVAKHGATDIIVSDNGREFMSREFESWAELHAIHFNFKPFSEPVVTLNPAKVFGLNRDSFTVPQGAFARCALRCHGGDFYN
jgi:hypothetical protein